MTSLAFAIVLTLISAEDGDWALRPIRRPEVLKSKPNPIDFLVCQAQAKAGLTMSPEADCETLIRRLSFDLRGLPPNPAEIDAFVKDNRADAYERLVDAYLASPAFGERWARIWLDLARYADSDGFELDGRRPNAWRYRDWVVNALNTDMPFDRFVRLQLAADQVAPDEPREKAALGFLRNGPSVANERTEKVRMDALDDIVSTTSSVFLGLTVGCARCHDHKADPISAVDYYRMVAIFASAKFADVSLVSESERVKYQAESQKIEGLLDILRVERIEIERLARERGDEATPLERSSIAECQARIQVLEGQMPPLPPEVRGVIESTQIVPINLLIRGDVSRRGNVVKPGPPVAVAKRVIEFPAHSLRPALADWIVDPANPLTARVQANRIWQGHFGKGLVTTASDFGAMGNRPAMPDLLDWLASEFVARGWSQKAIHRLIVTSAAYRQSNRVDNSRKTIDPAERMVWRYPLRRLDAEMIRDAILACAGSLDETRGGPGVFPPIDPALIRTGNLPRWPLNAVDGPPVWRRSLYVFRMRSLALPLLDFFDQPDAAQSCPQRTETTVATQALILLNDAFVIDQARRFADRVARMAGPEADARINLAFRIATGRLPTEAQRLAAIDYLRSQGDLSELCQVLFNSNAFLYVD